MRTFNYVKDYNIIGTTINGYITQMDKEIRLLKTYNNNPIYDKAISALEDFKTKYENLGYISSLILKDLLEPYSVEYCFKYGEYPSDASKLGMEFEEDLKKIFIIEDELRSLAVQSWQTRLTNFDDIVNGEDFMIVGHASVLLPGTSDFSNYRTGKYSKQFLSCSLLSGREFNIFNGIKTVFVTDIDEDNYIASSSEDSVTSENSHPSFETLKEIHENGEIHYIKVGYKNDIYKGVTTISTPDLIEELSVSREVSKNGALFNYVGLLTNEIVLDRTTTRVSGALLISDGCDLLVEEYLYLKRNNVKFKCLNKGLYKEKYGLKAYDEIEFDNLLKMLATLSEKVKLGRFSVNDLFEYYKEVVIPMNYSVEINDIIRKKISEILGFDVHEKIGAEVNYQIL